MSKIRKFIESRRAYDPLLKQKNKKHEQNHHLSNVYKTKKKINKITFDAIEIKKWKMNGN